MFFAVHEKYNPTEFRVNTRCEQSRRVKKEEMLDDEGSD